MFADCFRNFFYWCCHYFRNLCRNIRNVRNGRCFGQRFFDRSYTVFCFWNIFKQVFLEECIRKEIVCFCRSCRRSFFRFFCRSFLGRLFRCFCRRLFCRFYRNFFKRNLCGFFCWFFRCLFFCRSLFRSFCKFFLRLEEFFDFNVGCGYLYICLGFLNIPVYRRKQFFGLCFEVVKSC